jgi:hypothetical protein
MYVVSSECNTDREIWVDSTYAEFAVLEEAKAFAEQRKSERIAQIEDQYSKGVKYPQCASVYVYEAERMCVLTADHRTRIVLPLDGQASLNIFAGLIFSKGWTQKVVLEIAVIDVRGEYLLKFDSWDMEKEGKAQYEKSQDIEF